MSMSKRDYERIAGILSRIETHQELGYGDGWNDCRREIAVRLASSLKQDNPRFDPARFLKACGIGEE